MTFDQAVNKSFMFRGESITYTSFRDRMEKVKVYFESSHKDRILMKDTKTGFLYLYEFDEYCTFDSRGDLMNSTYVGVRSEEEADELANQKFIRQIPYVWFTQDNEIISEG